MLPFCLFIGVPLLILSRVAKYYTTLITQNGVDVLLSWLLVALLIFVLPEVSVLTVHRFSGLISRVRIGDCGSACGFGLLLDDSFASTGRTTPSADDIVSLVIYSLSLSVLLYVGLIGKGGFIFGLLSGLVFTGLLPLVLVFHFLNRRTRPPVEASTLL